MKLHSGCQPRLWSPGGLTGAGGPAPQVAPTDAGQRGPLVRVRPPCQGCVSVFTVEGPSGVLLVISYMDYQKDERKVRSVAVVSLNVG